MTISGSTNLHDLDAPQPMLLAATMLRVPGWEVTRRAPDLLDVL